MNFDYSPEQKTIKEQARQLLSDLSAPAMTRAALDGNAGAAQVLWQEMARLRWFALRIPEAYGGDGIGPVAQCALAEELGRALAPVSFSSALYVATEALLIAGTEAQKQRWLPPIAAGAIRATFAFSEGPGALQGAVQRSRCNDGRLYGTKLVPDGLVADIAVVCAQDAGRIGLHVVELAAAGVRREAVASIDPSRPWARIDFDAAAVETLPAAAPGVDILAAVLDRAAAYLAFEQLGGADRCLEMACAYALEREAFGRIIGQYQAVKHRLADTYVANELARSNAYYAAWALETASTELPVAAAVGRIAATDAFERASRELTQTLGGISATWAHDAHLYYRRSRHLAGLLGTAAEWRGRLVDHVDRATH